MPAAVGASLGLDRQPVVCLVGDGAALYSPQALWTAAHEDLPEWFRSLDHEAVTANCLSSVLRDLSERGWVHHIPRLMVLGNAALQRGYDPAELTAWFQGARHVAKDRRQPLGEVVQSPLHGDVTGQFVLVASSV